jgi:PAS domain S-box-containing protein
MAKKRVVNNIEERYRRLLEIIPDIVYRIDPKGYFTYVNNHIKLLGYNPKDLIGKHFNVILHPDEVKRVSRSVVLAKIKGKLTGDKDSPKLFDERRTGNRMTKWLEVKLIPKTWKAEEDGKTLVIGALTCVGEVAATGVYEDSKKSRNKKFIGTVGIIRDITEKKRSEEEKRRLELQYLQAQRLESIGLIASGIAHDFKNLLTIAIGYIDIAKELCPEDEKMAMPLTKAMDSLYRCKNLTQQLLSFSKTRKPKRKVASIADIVRKSSRLVLGGSNVECKYNIGKRIWKAEVDEAQITQVIENVVINARHAMPEGGLVEIMVKNITVKPELELPVSKGKYVEISVTDHGIGISEDHLGKLFDPFFTTKQDGSGLGLSITYSIIHKHNGNITAESELGKGSTFRIYLPAYNEKKTENANKKRLKPSKKK